MDITKYGINKPKSKGGMPQSIASALADKSVPVRVRITFVSDHEREEARIPSYGYILP